MIQPLTSLRFLFALFIFLHHFSIQEVSLFPEGYCAVSFFFILSGFILSYTYREKIQKHEIRRKDFYIRRFSRIYPLYFVCFLYAFLMILPFMTRERLWAAIPNVLALQSWFPQKEIYFSYDAPAWCISDELFFYLLFPFFSLYLNSLKKCLLVLSGMVLAGSILYFILPSSYEHAVFYIHPLLRSADFLVGISLYYLLKITGKPGRPEQLPKNKAVKTFLELAPFALLAAFIGFSSFVPQVLRYGVYYWIPMCFLIAVFVRTSPSGGWIARLFSHRYLVVLGEASFAFFMVHLLVMRTYSILIRRSGIILPDPVYFMAVLFTIIAVSLIIYRYFEIPAGKWIKKKLL